MKIQRYIILPIVLYGCETWSLTLKEKQRLQMFKNSVLRNTVGPNREKVTRGGRKFHIEELHELHSSQLFKQSNQGGDGQGIWHACGRQTHTGF